MGTSSRLYQILIKDKVEEDKNARKDEDFRGFPGFSAFHKLSKGIRTSFRRIRSFRSKFSRGKTFLSNKDSGYETEPRPTAEYTECDSLDSGLESDHSLDLSSSITKERARPKDGSSVDIVRKSSNRSNRSSRTIDSGVHSRTSPGCLVTNRLHSLPKKKVSIRLPGESIPLFGHQLHVETTRLVDVPVPELHATESVSRQRKELMGEARRELKSLHPNLTATISLVFNPEPVNLEILDINTISNLIYELRTVLYSSFHTVNHFQISLFHIQHFLLRLSSVLDLGTFPSEFEELMDKSEKLGYSRKSFLLQETQSLYVELWCSLLDSY